MQVGETVSAKNTLMTGVWLVLVAFVAMFVYATARVLLLIFAGILIAVFLHGCGMWVCRHTGLAYRWGLSLTIVSLLAFFALCGWLIEPNVQRQVARLSQTLGDQLDQAQQAGNQSPWFEMLRSSAEKLLVTLSPVRSISDWFVDAIVIVFVGIYFAGEPKLYRRGVLALMLARYRKPAARAFGDLGGTLWRWFIGRLIGMAVIGLLVGISMWAVSIPLAFTLGLIAAVLEFVPYVGAIVSSFPALLLASQQGWQKSWIVLVLYLMVHGIDGYVVIPLVERKAVRIPPAVTITVQVAMFIAAGFLGVLVADPIAACCLVLIQRFYFDRPEQASARKILQEAHT